MLITGSEIVKTPKGWFLGQRGEFTPWLSWDFYHVIVLNLPSSVEFSQTIISVKDGTIQLLRSPHTKLHVKVKRVDYHPLSSLKSEDIVFEFETVIKSVGTLIGA